MQQKAKQTATKALYLFYFEQIIQHHLVLNVLPTGIMLHTIRSYHRQMEGLLRSCCLLEQLPALDQPSRIIGSDGISTQVKIQKSTTLTP